MKDGEYCMTMLDSEEGDSFFLEFGFDSKTYTMLIDTGPVKCWTDKLKPFLDFLISKNKKINVLIITHIDNDHIGGAIEMFQYEEYSELVEEVWFNGLNQILNIYNDNRECDNQLAYKRIIFQHQHNDFLDGIRDISANQAISLSSLLTNRGKNTKRITYDTPTMIFTDNFRIDFLLPTETHLLSLQNYFLNHLQNVGDVKQISLTTEGEIAFEHLMRDDDIVNMDIHQISKSTLDIGQIEKWAEAKAAKDQSVTNASSIVICITFYGEHLLFCGDATGQDIIEAIDNKKLPTDYEIIKLPHHGSNRNCLSMPGKLNGKTYLISTNSKKNSHPGKETLAKLVTSPTKETRHIVFNYCSPIFELFHNTWYEDKYNYDAVVSTIITNKKEDII